MTDSEAHDELVLLLRLNKSWHDGMSPEQWYQAARGWWVMSPKTAERVVRVLAVSGGTVREVYEPTEWVHSPFEGQENRIGFNGVVAQDRANYLGSDVSSFFRPGSANPVRYVPIGAVRSAATAATAHPSSLKVKRGDAGIAIEPGLLERVTPLLHAFDDDLLWHQSRAGQELFHSNTLAWLLRRFPGSTRPLLDLLGATRYDDTEHVEVWRERRNIDILVDPAGTHPKVVVENKLYSVPYPDQLVKYAKYPLPWSQAHGHGGAAGTRYVLLSLMKPSFPLPHPWVHVDYRDLADALDRVDAEALGRTQSEFARYRSLVHRLVSLAEAVDPAQALGEQFLATGIVERLPGHGLDGAIARMRYNGLAQLVQSHFSATKTFEVGGGRGGIITYWRRLSPVRRVGWQFQSRQLRFQVAVEEPHLQGSANRSAREAIAADYNSIGYFDFTDVEAVLGADLRTNDYGPGEWLHFNPDFVYRHRPVKPTVSTARLAEALAVMTRRADAFADGSPQGSVT